VTESIVSARRRGGYVVLPESAEAVVPDLSEFGLGAGDVRVYAGPELTRWVVTDQVPIARRGAVVFELALLLGSFPILKPLPNGTYAMAFAAAHPETGHRLHVWATIGAGRKDVVR
jgi:hypothetical protein